MLPGDYYALAEQIAGPLGPGVLTLQVPESSGNGDQSMPTESEHGRTIATAPFRARLVAEPEMSDYALKRRTIVIRYASDDRIVALLETVSPGNKSSRNCPQVQVFRSVAISARSTCRAA